MAQFVKDEVKQRILYSAKEEFLEKGFIKASIRLITSKAKTSKSNLYNYFKDKDELFNSVLNPTLCAIKDGLEKAKQFNVPKNIGAYTKEAQNSVVEAVAEFVAENINDIKLILFKAQGSSLENYKQDLLEAFTENMCVWVKSIRPDKNFSRFFIRCICSFYMNLIEQIILYGKSGEMQKYANEFTDFIYNGWKGLLE